MYSAPVGLKKIKFHLLYSRVFAEYHILEVCEKVQITFVVDLRTTVYISLPYNYFLWFIVYTILGFGKFFIPLCHSDDYYGELDFNG